MNVRRLSTCAGIGALALVTACSNAPRLGVAALKAARALSLSAARKAATVPAAAADARVPPIIGTVSFERACGAAPVPLSV